MKGDDNEYDLGEACRGCGVCLRDRSDGAGMTRINLHPKYGLNPTMPVCFWCGSDKGEIALLGSKYKGEAPPKMVLDYVPCAKCLEAQANGITCIEATTPDRTKNPPFAKEGSMSMTCPTGRWIVVTREGFERLPVDEKLKAQIIERGKCFLNPETFNQLFAGVADSNKTEGEKNGQDHQEP